MWRKDFGKKGLYDPQENQTCGYCPCLSELSKRRLFKKWGILLVQACENWSGKWADNPSGFSQGPAKSISSRPTGNDAQDDEHTLFKGGEYGTEVPGHNGINKNKRNRRKQRRIQNLKVIKRDNKVIQALNLPTICNLNPRSVYNKTNEFHTFVEQEEIDLLFMSESWEREHLTLEEIRS